MNVLALFAFGVGCVRLLFGLFDEFGPASCNNDPTRCPACHRDDLMRIEVAHPQSRIPLLHCRSCGDAYRWWAGTLVRDRGDCQLP
jgi:hypothetical protein